MKSGRTMPGKHALRAALCAGMLAAAAGSARALELKDFFIEFPTIEQRVATSPDRSPSKDEHRSGGVFNAIAGTIVSKAAGDYCMKGEHSFVYRPGTATGTAECPKERSGTATVYREKGGTATYQTSMTVAGSIVTLRGRMTGRGTYNHMYCGELTTSDITIDVTQTLKVRIVGRTCQVLEFSKVSVVTERAASRQETTTQTSRLAPNAKCRFGIRSEQPVDPPLPPGTLVGVVPKCG